MRDIVLAKLHAYEQEMLDEIARICDKYALRYYLIAGTLLGAVRHQGFIPWDDDLDIAMPREDYLKFIEICKTELHANYYLQCYQTDNDWNRIFAKIRMNNTVFLEPGYGHLSRNTGIFIDIFPLDVGKKHGRLYEKIKNKYVKVIKAHIRMATGEIPMNRIHTLMAKVIPLRLFFSAREKWFHKKGDFYINYGSNYGTIKQTMPIRWYDPAIKLEFEGKEYSVPHEYKAILQSIFGKNYMELPPVNKRVTHDPIRLSFDTDGPDEVLED